MANQIKFEDNRVKVYGSIDSAIEQFLTEASGEIVSQTARNSRVDTGQLKASWQGIVKGNEAIVGSPLENAVWEEYGTGIHAENGNGRKGGWAYEDRHGNTVWTMGKTKNPKGLRYTFNTLLPKIKKYAYNAFKLKVK